VREKRERERERERADSNARDRAKERERERERGKEETMESERRNIEEGRRGRSSECSNRARDCDRANLSFGCPFLRPTGSL
jgi:hypothetical protein